MEQVWTLLLVIVILTFFQRSLIRLIFPRFIDYDTYHHLFYINIIRQTGLRDEIIDRLIIPSPKLYYPWLSHYILSFFSREFVDKYLEKFVNPFIDSLFTGFIFCVTYFLTNSIKQALYVALMYIFTPIFFSVQSTGPRIKSFTPRLWGEILVSFISILEFLYLTKHGGIELIVISCFLGSLIFVTSKFSSQAFLFISTGLAILSKELIPLVVFLFIGRWLDNKFGYKAFFVFYSMAFSLLSSSYGLFKKIQSLDSKVSTKQKHQKK